MLPKLVRIADWYSIGQHTLLWVLQYPNSAVPSSSLLSLEQKSTDSITETCCWRRNCYISNPQHCWRRVCLPARQCASTSCSWHSRASAPWDTPVHQSLWQLSQQSWPQPGRLPHLGHAARVLVSSTNPRYRRVAEAPCCNMGWISPERGGLCSWLVSKKTGSMYPCRRWSLWTLALTLLAWHSNCHTSQPVLLRATNVWRNATLPSVRSKSFAFYKVVRWHFSGIVGKGIKVFSSEIT